MFSLDFANDSLIDLYTIDTRPIGGSDVLRFTPSTDQPGAVIKYDSIDYTAYPIDASGFEWKGKGVLPRPKLSAANLNFALSGYLKQYDDFRGARVTRVRTFAKHLDGGSAPSTTQHTRPEVYYVDVVSRPEPGLLVMELASKQDLAGVQFPPHTVIKDYCPFVYRAWSGTGFDYSKATCPYVGAAYFDADGSAVTVPQDDVCSKLLSTGCEKRYPKQQLPFGGFPSVGRYRGS